MMTNEDNLNTSIKNSGIFCKTPYRKWADSDLEVQIKRAVENETSANLAVLRLLSEIERRRLFSKTQPSLFDYCVKVLKYSNGAAQRRIDSMRALKVMPELEHSLRSGALNLTSISQAQNFFRYEARAGKIYSLKEQKELLKKLENKTTRECLRTLLEISPNALPTERRRPVTVDKTEMRLVVDNKLLAKMDRLKSLLSHKCPRMTDLELLEELADIALEKLDPLLKAPRGTPVQDKPEVADGHDIVIEGGSTKNLRQNQGVVPAPEAETLKRQPISTQLRAQVYQRDGGQCTYPGCHSEFFLEIDHARPVASGGKTSLDNLRLLCRAHNQRAAIDIFGFNFMDPFINGRRGPRPKNKP